MHNKKIKQVFTQEIKELFETNLQCQYAYVIDTDSYVVKTDMGLIHTKDEPALQRRLRKEHNKYIRRIKKILTDAPHILEMDMYSEIWDDGFNIGNDFTELYSYSGTNEHIRIPPGVTHVVRKAFKDYDGLTLTFNQDLETIGYKAFYGWEHPTELRFNHKIETVGDKAFYGWSNLTQVFLSHDLISIGDNAFAQTPELVEVIALQDTPPELGDTAFGDNSNFTIYVPTDKVYLYKNQWTQYKDQIKSIVERPIAEVD